MKPFWSNAKMEQNAAQKKRLRSFKSSYILVTHVANDAEKPKTSKKWQNFAFLGHLKKKSSAITLSGCWLRRWHVECKITSNQMNFPNYAFWKLSKPIHKLYGLSVSDQKTNITQIEKKKASVVKKKKKLKFWTPVSDMQKWCEIILGASSRYFGLNKYWPKWKVETLRYISVCLPELLWWNIIHIFTRSVKDFLKMKNSRFRV